VENTTIRRGLVLFSDQVLQQEFVKEDTYG